MSLGRMMDRARTGYIAAPGSDDDNSPGSRFPTYDSSQISSSGEIGAMRDRLNGMQAFQYQKKDNSGPLAEFDYQRNKANEGFNQQGQQNEDAINRRFAAMGNLNSGSAVKAAQISHDQTAHARGDALAGIGAQESAARRGLDENENNRAFQAGMAGNQFGLQKFEAGSRLSSLDMEQKKFEQDRRQNAYQNDLNAYKQKHSGGLFGSGGFLGTGIGA